MSISFLVLLCSTEMRRLFLRTSGSPQATPIVETPAHYAPTLFSEFGSHVRGGDWKCRAYYVLCLIGNTVQIYEKSSNNERKREKRLGFCGFQGYRKEVLHLETVPLKSWGCGSRNQGDFQDISYGLILYFVFMGCHILQMQPIAQSDGEISVMNVICIYGIVNFRQAEVVTGIKHHILVFVREADWYTEVYRL